MVNYADKSAPTMGSLRSKYRAFKRQLRQEGPQHDQSVRDIISEKNSFRRVVRALTGGNEKLENAAAICAAHNINFPKETVAFIREQTFGDRYNGLPLCELEQLMAVRANCYVILCCYEMVAPAVKAQLDGMLTAAREQSGDSA